jgi:hypothetical protein
MSDSKLIDARGPRFSALITTVVLAIALLTKNPIVIWFQTAVFAIGAISSPTNTPYAWVFKTFIKPKLKGEVPTEDIKPPALLKELDLVSLLSQQLDWPSDLARLLMLQLPSPSPRHS